MEIGNNQDMSKDPVEFPRLIDTRMYGDFLDCPRKYEYKYIRNIGKFDSMVELSFKACIHRGICVFWYSYDRENLDYDSSVDSGVTAIEKEWTSYGYGSGRTNLTVELCVDVYKGYIKHFPPVDKYIIPFKNKYWIETDIDYLLDISDRGYFGKEVVKYAGNVDMIVKYNLNLYAVLNIVHIDEQEFDISEPNINSMITGTCWAMRHFNKPVIGVMLRVASVRKAGIEYSKAILYRSESELMTWANQFRYDISLMVKYFEEKYYEQKFGDACLKSKGCEYLPICESKQADRAIMNYHVFDNWEPMAKNPRHKNIYDASEMTVIY